MFFSRPRVQYIFLILSVTLFVLSLILAFFGFPGIVEWQVNKSLRLIEGTEQYSRFKDLPFPMDFKVYIFDVLNPDEILVGKKPHLKEIGPFVYKQYRHKDIMYSDCESDSVTYTQNLTFQFDPIASQPFSDDHIVTVLNPALMSIYQLTEPFFLSGVAERCMQNEFDQNGLFIKTTVKKLLFDGIEFCRDSTKSTHPLPCQITNIAFCKIAEGKRNVDKIKKAEENLLSFSFLHFKTRPDGIYTVNKGNKDISKLGSILKWNHKSFSDSWANDSYCNSIKGLDGTIFPPRISKDTHFDIYSTDICRSVQVSYLKETSYQDIKGYEFGTKMDTLYAHNNSPNDDCYCMNETKGLDGNNNCFLNGVMDVQPCFGVPVVLSFPHFLWADHYRKYVEGLEPDENEHRTFLIIEPNTGTPLTGMKRIQLNIVVRPLVGIKSSMSISRSLLPLAWIEEGVMLNDEYVEKLKSSYFNKITLIEGFKWGLIAITSVLTILFTGLVIRRKFITNEK